MPRSGNRSVQKSSYHEALQAPPGKPRAISLREHTLKPIESQRIALDRRIVLRFADFDGFVTEYATNISMTGMFVRTKEPQTPGTPLSFELRLEDGAPLVRGSGWVVWARDTRESADRPAGMGIEFTELDRQSRRLVRWLILNQLPEGQSEFDVHAGTANAPLTVEVPTRAAIRRRRRAGVLTAMALFGLLAGLILWRGLGAPQADRQPPAGGSIAAAPIGVESIDGAGSAPSASAPLAPVAAISAESAASLGEKTVAVGNGAENDSGTALEAEAEALVREWARAWSAQNVEAYLAFYASDFVPEAGMTLSGWRLQRRRRLTTPASIRVGVARLEVTLLSGKEARVSLLQTYRSDGYADTVDKVLELTREDGVWKILREHAD